jgi:hypothetical protein
MPNRELDEAMHTLENGLVHFVVKDYNRFGHNKTIGETLIRFDKIDRDYTDKAFADVPQIELSLIKQVEVPQGKDMSSLFFYRCTVIICFA